MATREQEGGPVSVKEKETPAQEQRRLALERRCAQLGKLIALSCPPGIEYALFFFCPEDRTIVKVSSVEGAALVVPLGDERSGLPKGPVQVPSEPEDNDDQHE
jgi:hypothetical protein